MYTNLMCHLTIRNKTTLILHETLLPVTISNTTISAMTFTIFTRKTLLYIYRSCHQQLYQFLYNVTFCMVRFVKIILFSKALLALKWQRVQQQLSSWTGSKKKRWMKSSHCVNTRRCSGNYKGTFLSIFICVTHFLLYNIQHILIPYFVSLCFFAHFKISL